MWRVPWRDEAALAAQWRAADPFPHVVIDELIDPDHFAALFAILEDEPVERYTNDLYTFDATAPEPVTAAFAELRAEFARVLAPSLGRITGKPVTRAEMRAYAYREGDYLLPHADHITELRRQLAYAYYLPSPEPWLRARGAPEANIVSDLAGGELELFAGVRSARVIEPRANRIAVFDVSDVSLHQVREVMSGTRLSLAGWLYP